jgi:hypothetical protein
MQVEQRDCFATLQVMSARLPSPQNFLKLGDEKSGCPQRQLCVQIMFSASVLNKKQRGRQVYSSMCVLQVCVYVCMYVYVICVYVCMFVCVCVYICIIVIIDFIAFIVIFIITVVSRLGHPTSEADG